MTDEDRQMTFAQRFHDERARYIMSGKARIGTNEPEHCYLGVAEWREFEEEVRQAANCSEAGGMMGRIVYCGVEMHRLMEPSHFRFS